MTATEELRRLLDERGTEHTDLGGMTEWTNGCGRICRAYTRLEPFTVDVTMLAVPPEQAVEATLGRGTCYCDGSISWTWNAPVELYEHELSCGHVITSTEPVPPNYCEECGAKVLEPNSNLLGHEEGL